jgi:hypothetical protein
VAGCDAGSFHDQSTVGPPISVDVAGTNIETAHGYTVDQPIRVAFNRFLDPRTVTRQSVLIQDLNGNAVTEELIAYDPVTLTISLSNPGAPLAWLTPKQQYQVVLNVPSYEGGGPSGLQAIDGATLPAPLTLQFTAGPSAEPPFSGVPAMQFCRDVYPIFSNNCSFSGCHAAFQDGGFGSSDGGPRLGMDLASQQSFRKTALNQIADESNTGPLAATGAWSPGTTPFGVDMAIVAAGEPGNSWMMYKILLAMPVPPDAAYDFGSQPAMSAYASALVSPISASERAILSNYILGQSMPYPGIAHTEPSSSTLSEGDMERLSTWIAQGAQYDPTTPCQ